MKKVLDYVGSGPQEPSVEALVAVTGEKLDYKNVSYCSHDSKHLEKHYKEHCSTEFAEGKIAKKMAADDTQDHNLAVRVLHSLEEQMQEQ